MPPPSQLAIATSSLNRLVKEEASYHKELEKQQVRIANLQQDSTDENAEFIMKQEQRAVDETKAMFPHLRTRIQATLEKLEQQLKQDDNGQGNPEEITKAKEAIVAAKAVSTE